MQSEAPLRKVCSRVRWNDFLRNVGLIKIKRSVKENSWIDKEKKNSCFQYKKPTDIIAFSQNPIKTFIIVTT